MRSIYKKNGCLNEHEESKVFAQWLKLMYKQGKIIEFTKTAQETFTKSFATMGKNKAEGVRPGLPDYIIVLRTGVLFVELKSKDGGVVSDNQKRWIFALNERDGVEARVCKGADEAIAFVQEYIDDMELKDRLKSGE